MKREPWVESAAALLFAAATKKVAGCAIASSFADICCMIRKQLGDKEMGKSGWRQGLWLYRH